MSGRLVFVTVPLNPRLLDCAVSAISTLFQSLERGKIGPASRSASRGRPSSSQGTQTLATRRYDSSYMIRSGISRSYYISVKKKKQ